VTAGDRLIMAGVALLVAAAAVLLGTWTGVR
jgi:hypothetical protein